MNPRRRRHNRIARRERRTAVTLTAYLRWSMRLGLVGPLYPWISPETAARLADSIFVERRRD